MKKLFLDDVREVPDPSWDLVRSYDEFVAYIEANGVPDVISFDHDLSLEHYPLLNPKDPLTPKIPYGSYIEKTGYQAAKWLLERGDLPKVVVVHSFNPVGARNICNLFMGEGCQVIRDTYPLKTKFSGR